METEYDLMSYKKFETLVAEKRLRLMDERVLKDGSKLALYHGQPQCVLINRTVYAFQDSTKAIRFFVYTESAPLGATNYEIPISYNYAADAMNFKYNIMTYDFFKRCKLRCPWLKIISERILLDGRESIIYADLPYNRTKIMYLHYYLVIEDMVFTCYNDFGQLLNLEESINNGSITKWRPELTGQMAHLPAYNINVFTRHHERYIRQSTLIRTHILSGSLKAEVYERIGKSTRYYMRVEDKIYMFASLADCEIIIDLLKSSSNLEASIEMDAAILKKNIEAVATRLNRYINSDMEYYSSSAFKVSETGSLICLSPSI